MSMFGTQSRDDLRRAYAEAWQKHVSGLPLAPLEAMIADVITVHPEYQPTVADAETALGFEPAAVQGRENPFLHLGLHLAVRDQISIDRPPGVRALKEQFEARYGDAHGAEHALMECLAETLWEAQRSGQAPDEGRYVARARARLSSR